MNVPWTSLWIFLSISRYSDLPMVCRLPPLPPLANYNNHSPESCGHFGIIPLTNHDYHDSRVRENSEVVVICPDHCIPWISHEYPMNIPWISHEYPMNIPLLYIPLFSIATIGQFNQVSAILFRSLSSLVLHWAIAQATLERLSSAADRCARRGGGTHVTQKNSVLFHVYVSLYYNIS